MKKFNIKLLKWFSLGTFSLWSFYIFYLAYSEMSSLNVGLVNFIFVIIIMQGFFYLIFSLNYKFSDGDNDRISSNTDRILLSIILGPLVLFFEYGFNYLKDNNSYYGWIWFLGIILLYIFYKNIKEDKEEINGNKT